MGGTHGGGDFACGLGDRRQGVSGLGLSEVQVRTELGDRPRRQGLRGLSRCPRRLSRAEKGAALGAWEPGCGVGGSPGWGREGRVGGCVHD